MSTKKKSKKPGPFPIEEAHRISFVNQQPESYYNQSEKEQLQSQKNKYNVKPKKAKRKQPETKEEESSSEESASSSSESEEENPPKYEEPKKKKKEKQKEKTPPKYDIKPKKEKKSKSKNDDGEENKEEKGLLAKLADKTKEAVGIKEKPKLKNTRVIIELPRDILTAFFLLRLPRDKTRRGVERGEEPPYWEDYAFYGKVCLWLSVLLPYGIQWFTTAVLLQELASKWNQLKEVEAEDDFWYNTVAFSILFLYMWKDLASFYYSVWYYINYLQRRKGGIVDNLKQAAVHVKDESAVDVAEGASEAVEEMKTAVKFIEFRLWLLSVVFLYVGLTTYSLLSIPLAEGLVDKLEVSLSIFFVLEVDDWAYELFIAQANILEDEEFDVEVIVKKDRRGFVRRQQRQLAKTLILVVISILGFWAIGWTVNELT